jgi:hypothetical protein
MKNRLDSLAIFGGPAPKFIIWVPTFDEKMGGAIVMHLLCHRLNEMGQTAHLWPASRPLVRWPPRPRSILRWLRYALIDRGRHFSTGPFPSVLASPRDVPGSIVVYPEIVRGNPLKADHVVRWFLHKPGFHTGIADYGPGELYFFIVDAFNDEAINPTPDNRLTLQWTNEAYRDRGGDATRSGSCYLMRHGAGRALAHDLRNSVPIDGLSHAEKADAFNRCERFYSYDPYTFYLWYAAICGCIPIVVPEPGMSRRDWKLHEEDRYGIAYGEADIPWAIETRGKLLDKLRSRRETEDMMVRAFIDKCKAWYANK